MRLARRLALLAAALAPLAAAAGAAGPANRLVLYRLIGPVAIGERLAAVQARLGDGNDMGGHQYRYAGPRIDVGFDPCGDGRQWCVTSLHTASSRYATARGARVGMSVARLRTLYPGVRVHVDRRGVRNPEFLVLQNPHPTARLARVTLFIAPGGTVRAIDIAS